MRNKDRNTHILKPDYHAGHPLVGWGIERSYRTGSAKIQIDLAGGRKEERKVDTYTDDTGTYYWWNGRKEYIND